jgi:hypothetical protein
MGILSDTVNESKKHCGCGQDPCVTYGKQTEEVVNEIDPSRSPWTQSGKHPGAMNQEELEREIAVFNELRDRGDHLSPRELAQEDSLYHYLEQFNEDECSTCNGSGWDQSVTPDEDDRGCDECGGTGKIETESYSPGDEYTDSEGMVSGCCGAPMMDYNDGFGRCSDCKEMASGESEEAYYETAEIQRLKDLIRY